MPEKHPSLSSGDIEKILRRHGQTKRESSAVCGFHKGRETPGYVDSWQERFSSRDCEKHYRTVRPLRRSILWEALIQTHIGERPEPENGERRRERQG